MRQDPDKYAWVKYTRDLLCSHGVGNVWRDQFVINEKLFLANFEQRPKDTFIQNCISDVESSNKCRMYREIKTVYKCENYMDCNIRHDLARISWLNEHGGVKNRYHTTKEHAHCVTFMMYRMSIILP